MGGKIIRFIRVRLGYHVYKCPKCNRKIEIPRGKGRVAIICPDCHTEFIKIS